MMKWAKSQYFPNTRRVRGPRLSLLFFSHNARMLWICNQYIYPPLWKEVWDMCLLISITVLIHFISTFELLWLMNAFLVMGRTHPPIPMLCENIGQWTSKGTHHDLKQKLTSLMTAPLPRHRAFSFYDAKGYKVKCKQTEHDKILKHT
jgi:hypothetical protein